MHAHFTFNKNSYKVDLAQPIDLSLLLREGFGQVNCFWAPPVEYAPVVAGDFIGDTTKGGPVNFFNVRFNPHGNGTHTECVGHIAKEKYVLRDCLREAHFLAKLISVYPQKREDGDRVIVVENLMPFIEKGESNALIIRTLPNEDAKKTQSYSGTNPPYIHQEAMLFLVECGIEHLLLDLPSVDREEDGGALLAHKAFWQYPEAVRAHCTITELIFVPNEVKDGLYLLNLQTASFELDASPSRPIIFAIE
jgi:kynurenine formamidase